jgi:hypothetical protein
MNAKRHERSIHEYDRIENLEFRDRPILDPYLRTRRGGTLQSSPTVFYL